MMSDSPFSDAFDESKFYTQSSDKHHHNERLTIRIPGDWLHFAGLVANSPLCPEYESVSDIVRDGFAKAVAVALDKMGDETRQAEWSTRLALIELLAKKANDERELETANEWNIRLQAGHGYETGEFFRDAAAMKNPNAITMMANSARIYNLSNS